MAVASFVVLGIVPAIASEADSELAQGLRLYQSRSYRDALKHLETALSLGNGSLDTYLHMGKCNVALGNRGEATRIFQQMEVIFRGGGGEQIARDELRALGASGGVPTISSVPAANSVKTYSQPPATRVNDQYFNHAMKLLKARQFAEARKYFDYKASRSPGDHEAHYYKGLCHHYVGDKAKAKEVYEHIVMNFPGSTSAAQAASNLRKLSPGTEIALGLTKSGSNVSLVTSAATIPNETRVYFRMDRNQIMIPAKLNGREFEFKFDTGASITLVKKEDFDKAQLHIPEKAMESTCHGVGGAVPIKVFDADVSVGGVSKRFPIAVTDGHAGNNLLGQDFLNSMEYEFDHKANFITFRPNKEINVAKDNFAVPFRLHGKHLVVDVMVPGGKKTALIVDTGAYGILLTQKNFQELGLTVPIASSRRSSSGVGDLERWSWEFFIDELRLGPIVCREPQVSVMDHEDGALAGKDDIGLLGMEFFGNWRYTVDNKNQVLRFHH